MQKAQGQEKQQHNWIAHFRSFCLLGPKICENYHLQNLCKKNEDHNQEIVRVQLTGLKISLIIYNLDENICKSIKDVFKN